MSKFLGSQQNDCKTMFENTQHKFKELSQKVTHAAVHYQALQEKNQRLPCLVSELSAKTSQLQAGEQEHLAVLKLKDQVVHETTTSKLKEWKSALDAGKMKEIILSKEERDLEQRLKELILERNKLKDYLREKMRENNMQQEEIIRLKQENDCLRQELALAVEKAKTKDQLLQFAKSKQAWTDAELSSLQQFYIKQLYDLQFLRVNLEKSQELRQKREMAAHERSVFSAPESNSQPDTVWTEGTHRICEACGTAQFPKNRAKTTSEMCELDNGWLLNASNLEETTSAYLNQCQKVVKVLAVTEEEKQDVASSSDQLGSKVFCKANNISPLRNKTISENGVKNRDRQTFKSSLPECKPCLNFSSCVDSQSALSQDTITADKTANENKTWQERTGNLFDQKSRETPVAMHKSESDSCSNDFIIKKDALWKPVSDQEWLKIFKPIKGDGSI